MAFIAGPFAALAASAFMMMTAPVDDQAPQSGDLTHCKAAWTAYEAEAYSRSISLINQCINEGDLTDGHYGAALFLRAMNYDAMGADDKAEGDRTSALEKHEDAEIKLDDFKG